MTTVNPLPNVLTWIRIIAGVAVFALLAAAAGGFAPVGDIDPDQQFLYEKIAVIVFLVGAVTDFFDGFLARKLHAETAWGATLDPIADKVLICGVILGLLSLNVDNKWLAIPSAIILFREFTVSALRESSASRGVTLKVTLLAKWKTTVQLVAFAVELIAQCLPLGLPDTTATMGTTAHVLVWIAALLTLWTGGEYVIAARKAISHEA
ncbi:MAG TPA: CDP-diacylglycerol--glycerol-3-phosphate 3-phosphatidyltransferase [Caulobacteraceae bacterium]|jgi:CDP-diacylglycerol--glycerol-3-phosphate 3-phosphatidyltransferase|nr:CDP-diacylglycerol--glycerol-3-phosphate 3-phosphatidyltransferase [Caulobacteraceae bacterium]